MRCGCGYRATSISRISGSTCEHNAEAAGASAPAAQMPLQLDQAASAQLVGGGADDVLSSSAWSRANALRSSLRTRSREMPSSRSIVSSDCCSPSKPKRSSSTRRSSSGRELQGLANGLPAGRSHPPPRPGRPTSDRRTGRRALRRHPRRPTGSATDASTAPSASSTCWISNPGSRGELLVRRRAAVLGLEAAGSTRASFDAALVHMSGHADRPTPGLRSRADTPGGSTRWRRSRT